MELWIRSQDKIALRKINTGLYLREDLSDYAEGEVWFVVSGGDKLGEYKTKERALEVLDEIQNMIKPTLITTEYHSEIKQDIDKLSFDVIMQPVEDKITYIQPNAVIYEMPQE